MKTEKSELCEFDIKAVRGYSGIIGVDEAGRGSLAGPVVAAAVWLDSAFLKSQKLIEIIKQVNDSKQLSASQRNKIYEYIVLWEKESLLKYAWAQASVVEIDVCNILGATKLAMRRALDLISDRLALPVESEESNDNLFENPESLENLENPPIVNTIKIPRILIDGRALKPFHYKHEGIVGGDAKSLAIAMASIVAKVNRDRLMCELDKQYSLYSFAENKGYGTALHRKAIETYGPCDIHRPLFLRKLFDRKATVLPSDDPNQLNLL